MCHVQIHSASLPRSHLLDSSQVYRFYSMNFSVSPKAQKENFI